MKSGRIQASGISKKTSYAWFHTVSQMRHRWDLTPTFSRYSMRPVGFESSTLYSQEAAVESESPPGDFDTHLKEGCAE
jgi:hypothetical protein